MKVMQLLAASSISPSDDHKMCNHFYQGPLRGNGTPTAECRSCASKGPNFKMPRLIVEISLGWDEGLILSIWWPGGLKIACDDRPYCTGHTRLYTSCS